MPVWRHILDDRAGYLYDISNALRIVELSHPGILIPVDGGTLIVASDYSGQHKEASHEAYSFIVTVEHDLEVWLPSLRDFRGRWLPDDRRLSFKKIKEPVRWRALPAFLQTVATLNANLITILIDRRVGSFVAGGPAAAVEGFPDCFPPHAKQGTVEKMIRLASFVALILAGLRDENQGSYWISDHDEALDSHEKRELFARLSTYLTIGLAGWRGPADHRFVTTESSLAPFWSEDVAAIADLAAGAYCKMSACLAAFFGTENWLARVDPNFVTDPRARLIGDWLAGPRGALRNLLLRMEQDISGEVRVSAQAFVGIVD